MSTDNDINRRIETIERIKAKAVKANGGITTLWALRNATKKLLQDWKVAECAQLVDGKGRGSLLLNMDWLRAARIFGNDQACFGLLREITEKAEDHGYEVTEQGPYFTMVRVE